LGESDDTNPLAIVVLPHWRGPIQGHHTASLQGLLDLAGKVWPFDHKDYHHEIESLNIYFHGIMAWVFLMSRREVKSCKIGNGLLFWTIE